MFLIEVLDEDRRSVGYLHEDGRIVTIVEATRWPDHSRAADRAAKYLSDEADRSPETTFYVGLYRA